MKTEGTIDLSRVHDTLSFVEENYNRVISITELERISNYSYRNIQRIFKYTCSETIGAYQKRLKVENAYKMILYTKESLSSIALEVGFANLASFSKAFKQRFGIAPKEARAGKEPLLAEASILPVEADMLLEPEIVYVPPTPVYYQRAFISYVHEEIELLWEQFMQHAFPAYGNEYYGIIADEPLIREDLKCRYDTCSFLQATDKKLPSKMIAGGRYAQFTHTGVYETIEDTYQRIYSGWILNTNLEFAAAPVVEKYIKHPDNTATPEEQLTYIWLPLK
ncbi:MAG TPA: AraC family transcriptional regulator [Chitinophaga sp.]|uniref:AraC family transcriptional regulator n=1 Tax=Chitinophaga sp. TaxID=1869181 RepID=UPI002C101F78|nr:AraC family transcriptional regulator [Chitinophaga sp.]HVI45797.1 AraC family transcriptional regulator [Chitinophaga sp.]